MKRIVLFLATNLAILLVLSMAARAVGLWVTGTSISSAVAPAFGGIVGGVLGWRWAFLVVVPFVRQTSHPSALS